MTEPARILLIDGHALAFRAFYALANTSLATSQGEPTYAVFGFCQILLTTLNDYHPHSVAVAFDVGRTFRDDLYADYKAGRSETPAEFEPQLARMQEVLRALNIPIYTAQGYEADDVIGTLARQASAQQMNTLILTGDTDTLQLVNAQVQVLLANPYGKRTTTTLYDEASVHERYKGLRPDQLADLRGLKGDASDNIPGVKGIGEKSATQLLGQFGSVEQIYEHLDEVPSRYRSKLDGQREAALFSKRLAVIVCDVPLVLDAEAARLDDYDRSAIIALFQELEFGKSLVEKLPAQAASIELHAVPAAPAGSATAGAASGSTLQLAMFDMPAPAARPPDAAQAPTMPQSANLGNYRSVTSEDDLHALLGELNSAQVIAFDCESTGLSPLTDTLVGISLATHPGSGWYVPLAHRDGPQLPADTTLAALRPFLSDPQTPKYAHNAKFDIELLQQAGITVQGLAFDGLLAARLLGRQRASLKDLAFYELKLAEPMTEIEALIGRGAKQTTFDTVPIAQATAYAAADADITLRLSSVLQAELEDDAQTAHIFRNIEMPLVPVLVAMETAGILLDTAYMQQLDTQLRERISTLEQTIYALAGEKFNINSGAQLNTVLFERLELPSHGLSRTSSGRFSLTADVLERLSSQHEIIQVILRYRQMSKLKSTYVDALPGLVNPHTGRIHTSYNQLGAATGRLSSATPNMQNIPVRSDEGGEIRRAFVAAPGHQLFAADYSQIELRVLAHITEDPNLRAAFLEGQDIHATTASQLFGVSPAEVSKEQRRIAKTVVFGVVYGISSFGLAQRTDLSRGEAQALIDALFARFPGIRTYIDETLSRGRRDGYVQSLFGRRRAMPELHSGHRPRRLAAEREAINAPVQATAADIMKIAMLRVAHALQTHGLRSRLLLQVHDELVFEAPDDEIDTLHTLVRTEMEHAHPDLAVPLSVDVEAGHTWGDMHGLNS